jgi:hypothetical protein
MISEAGPLADASGPDPSAAALAEQRVVPGRACGSCTLCCKLIAVIELQKPPGEWCRHCRPGSGCGIHQERPAECRVFFCHWMLEKSLSADWKPEKAKFALVTSAGGHMTAFVDPGFPGAWRNPPYFETFKRWSLEGTRASPPRIVTVRIGTRAIVVLPDREIDAGHVGPNDALRLETGPGGRIEVRKVGREVK